MFSTIGGLAGNFFAPGWGGAVGTAIGGALDANSAQSAANSFNEDEAQKNRDFQAQQSATAYQRGVADMKAAGLNPMLAYQNGPAVSSAGSMASYPTGAGPQSSQASASAVQAYNDTQRTQSMINLNSKQADLFSSHTTESGYRMNQLVSQTQNIKDENAKIKATTDLIKQQANKSGMDAMLTDQLISKAQEEIKSIGINNFLNSLKIPAAENKAASDQTWWGRVVRPYVNDAGKAASSAATVRYITK